MMADIYGLNNLGTNLGISFILGGSICGYLQTFGGEWYAKTIEDMDIVCHGAPCFRQLFVINQSLICMSFVLFITLRQRIRIKNDIRKKGVEDVKYLDDLAEHDYMTSRAAKKTMFVEKQQDDVWKDGQLLYSSDHAQEVMRSNMKQKKEKKKKDDSDSSADKLDSFQSTAEWTEESGNELVFGGKIAKRVFQERIKSPTEQKLQASAEAEMHYLEKEEDVVLESSSESASEIALLGDYLDS